MATDKKDLERGAKARRAPVKGTSYTDGELNAPVRGFPPASDIWDPDRIEPVLLNPKQVIETLPADAGRDSVKMSLTYHFLEVDGKLIHPVIVLLQAHILLRKYKTHATVERLKFLAPGDRIKEKLYGWDMSTHDIRRSIDLLTAHYGTGAIQFREHACEFYRENYKDWLSSGTASRRAPRSISSNAGLLEHFSMECAIIVVLRRAFDDAASAASEWPSVLAGKHVPSLNKFHRIMNPKKHGSAEINDDEMFITSVVVSFFGCTNAAHVYPKTLAHEDVFGVLCFFGRVNLGKIGPTVREAEAFLKYCEVCCAETIPAAINDILAAADSLCGWTKFRVDLGEVCRMTIEADASGRPLPCRFGRLWPMV